MTRQAMIDSDADLFRLASGGKINAAWNGRTGGAFYAEDRELGSVLIDLTLEEVEALRDRMAEIARQIRDHATGQL